MSSSQNPLGMFATAKEDIERSLGSSGPAIPKENIEIHSMRNEIAAAKNGGARPQPSPISMERREKEMPFEPKNNPFFEGKPESEKAAEKIEAGAESPKAPIRDSKGPGTSEFVDSESGSRLKWLIGPAILAILMLVGGGYYFWNSGLSGSSDGNDSGSANDQESLPTNEPSESSQEQSSDVAKAAFSQTGPNYMQIKDSDDLFTVIGAYANRVVSEKYAVPIEFVLTDNQNDPISLDSFLAKSQIVIPSAIRATLGTEYSLFIFNDAGKARIGMEASCANEAKAAQELSKEEPSLVKYFRPLYLGLTIPATGSFASSSYAGTNIRYVNLDQANGFSLDYSVFRQKLLIGTSKNALRAIIDSQE